MVRSFFTNKVGPSKTISENSVASCPTVNTGSWKEATTGKYITIQQWRLLGSNMKFVCRGRWMFIEGWGWGWFLSLIFLVELLGILSIFGYFEVWKNTSSFGKMVFPLVHLIFGIFSIVYAFCVVFTDPGILAPGVHDVVKDINERRTLRTYEKTAGSEFPYTSKKYEGVYDKMIPKIIEIDGEQVERFYCLKCCVYRDFRTYHCTDCGVCIERYDHHCPVFGRCIGRRNYGYFIKFLWSMAFSLLGIIIYSVINLITIWIAEGFCVAASKSPTSFALLFGIIFPPCGIPFIFQISYSHLRLVWSDTTLKEWNDGIKGLATPIKLQAGFCQAVLKRVRHICYIICSKPPPPTIHPHQYLCVKAIPRGR